jgi:hypothetical protein
MATNAITGLTDEEEAYRRQLAQERGNAVFGGAAKTAASFLDPTDPLNYLGMFGKSGKALFALTAGMRPQEANAMVVGVDDVARMARATGMHKSGASPGRILQETKLVRVPTKTGFTWGEQISDLGARVRPEVLEQVKTALTKNIDANKQIPVNNITLDALLEHPELFKRYPELKNISVEQVNGFQAMGGVQGFYDEASKVLGVKKLNPYMTEPKQVQKQLDDLTSTLIHEAQHAIQGIEKWPRGGNSAEFSTAGFRKVEKTAEEAKIALTKAAESAFLSNGIKPIYGAPSLVDDVANFQIKGEDYLKYKPQNQAQQIREAAKVKEINQLIRAKARVDKTFGKIADRKKADFKKYESIAGEAQSRATQEMLKAAKEGNQNLYQTSPITGFYDIPENELLFRDPFAPTIK